METETKVQMTFDPSEGACAKTDNPELFFPAGVNWQIQAREAKEVCATCPMVKQCMDFALANGIGNGIWGGTTGAERTIIRKFPYQQDLYIRQLVMSKGKRDLIALKGNPPSDD